MTQDDLEAFASRLQGAFLAGNMASLRAMVRLPLVIYSLAGVAVIRTEAEFAQVVETYLKTIESLEPARTDTRLLDHSAEPHGRYKFVARNRLFDRSDKVIFSSKMRYFVVETKGDLAAEMIEYLETPLDLSTIQKIYL